MRPLGLYVHWPFCRRLCPYCDFTIAKVRDVDELAWARALTDDIKRMAEFFEPRPLRSVYFGGGTPSLIPEAVAEAVLSEASRVFGFEEGAEFTIEANPDDAARFQTLRSLGFERLSLGVQSLDDRELQFLGRNHNAATAYQAIEAALVQFDRISLDFIYALPDQSSADWRARLEEICRLGASHLSLYQLTVEPGTAFGRAASRGTLIPMPDDHAADLYELTQEVTAEAGLPAYEISNHARLGDEARHNALYWDDADWIGIGPGAAGRGGGASDRFATEAAKRPVDYPTFVPQQRITISPMTEHDHLLEVLGGGLRPTTGLEQERLGSSCDTVMAEAKVLADQGLLTIGNDRIIVTERGRLLTDYIASRLASSLPDSSSGAA